MMTKKILFLLTFLLTTIGGGHFALAQTTVGYTEAINGSNLEARNLSVGGLSNLTISGPTYGSSIDNYAGSLKTVYLNGVTYTSTDSWRKSENGTSYSDNQYIAYTLTVNEGYTLNISNVAARILPSDDATFTWKVVIYDKDGTAQYTSSDQTTTRNSAADLNASTSISNLTGTVTVKLFIRQPGGTKHFCINYLQLGVTIGREQYSDSYPYTWDFTTWQTTSADLSADSHWNEGTTTVSYKSNLNGGSALLLGNGELPETKGLVFNTNTSSRVVAYPNNYLQMYSTTITVPSLKAGNKVTFTANKPAGHGSNAVISVGGVNINKEEINGKFVFTYNVPSDGNVNFLVDAYSGDPQQLLSIKVEKGDFAFSEHHTQYWDGSASTNTKSGAYKDRTTNFSVQANVPAGASISKGNFTVTSSSNSSVIDVSSWDYSDTNLASGEIWFNNLIINGVGTDVLTFTYGGNDAYNSKSFTVTVNVYKGDPTFVFTYGHNGATEKNYSSEETFTITLNKSSDISIPSTAVTFTSSDEHVATVTSSGEITVHNSGSTTIRAKFAGNDNYNTAETWTYLVVNGSSTTSETLSWNTDPDTSHSGNDDGNNRKVVTVTHTHSDFSYTATASEGSTVNYKSSNSDVATVSSTGLVHVIRPGETWINAYIDGQGDENGKEIKYYLKVTGSAIDLSFSPSSGTVSPGCIIMPRLVIPTMEKDNITKLTIESSNTAVATVPSSNLLTQSESLTMQGTRIDGVHPIINGIANGPATITVKFQSPYYNNGEELTATYTVTVSDDQTSTTWKTDKREYTLATGEFMMMPAINGNFNGNINGLSKGTVSEANHGYAYQIVGSARTVTWNSYDYYLGEGNPDYTLTSAGGTGYIFWCTGENGSKTMPTLMIYAESPGDVILRATDSQTGYTLDDITIHIVDKASHVTEIDESFWADKTFPFTWDFTNVRPTDITDDDVHWRAYGFNNTTDAYGKMANTGEHYLGMATAFNYDYADENQDGVVVSNNRPKETKKYFMNGEGDNCKIMPAFYGLQLELGNGASGSYWSKRDRVRLYDTSASNPHLNIQGGQHYLYLPALPAARTPNTAYRLYVKAKGATTAYEGENIKPDDCSRINVGIDDGAGGYTNVGRLLFAEETKGAGNYIAKCEYCDISAANAGKAIRLNFDKNLEVYWIALSTEARTLMRPENTTYAAATYSYGQDLDLIKSNEVNGVTAYYASGFTLDNNVSAGSTTGEETQYAVKMKPLTSLNNGTATYVTANKGILLKKSADVGNTNCYMIANPRNVDSYSAPETITGDVVNYLVGTGANSADIAGRGNDGDGDYTNFLMGYAYKYYTDITNPDSGSEYRFDRDWSFYPLIVSGTYNLAAQRSYLHIPRNVYVNKNGEIVDMPTSARAAFDVESAADDTAEAPATKAALSIVFDDSVPATPEDPATEEPEDEDGDSDKDKDRPRKPGDDGWPKPPFPPFPPIITDIDSVNTETTDNAVWHSMEGVRISQPTKPGLYIRNGKKIVIK